MFASNEELSLKSSETKDMIQELHDVTVKLEFVQQQLSVIRLEKIELEKEINQLKLENERVMEENNEYIESSQMEQQQMLFLRKISMKVNEVNSYNDDLNTEIVEYKDLIKTLQKNNINLQKENEKYKIILEQLNEEKQGRDEIHINNMTNLQNKIKELEHECDELREEVNTFNAMQLSSNSCLEEKEYIDPKPNENNDNIFKVRNKSLNGNDIIDLKAMLSEFGNNTHSDSGYNETQIVNNDIIDIMDQLNEFGEDDIMNTVNNDNECENNMDNKCAQYIAEIDSYKCIIKLLRKQIKWLGRQNEELLNRKFNGCTLFNLFK